MSDNQFFTIAKTQYVVILPKQADYYENYAQKEFIRLFKEVTSISIKVFTDDSIELNGYDKFISIGRTNQFAKSGVEADYSTLHRDGYRIVSKNDCIYLVGGGSYGTVYAVYGFFERQFGYRYYMEDEYVFNNKDNINLMTFDVTDIPDIENRTSGFYYGGCRDGQNAVEKNGDCSIRWKALTRYGFFRDGSNFFGSWAHNHIKEYLPLRLYEHNRTWYSPELTQLCLTNEEMWEEMVERVKQRIIEKPDAEYFLLGQEDTPTFCGCSRCQEQIKIYGESGVMMRFINYVARKIKEWLKAYAPERHVLIGTFAYQKTQDPPVIKDENGKYKAIDKSVIPEENVFILLATLGADWSVPLDDENHNAKSKLALDGWSALTDKIILWAYCANFNRCLTFFDNFDTIDANYRLCKKYKFKWFYFENFAAYKQSISFQAMLGFVNTQLAWNTSLNSKDLIDEFMRAYYKEAYPFVKEYLYGMINYYSKRKEELNISTGRYHGTYIWQGAEKDVYCKSFYDLDFLNKMWELLTKGINLFDNLSNYDEISKIKLKQRIKIERLTIRYIIAEFFYDDMSKEEYLQYLDEFEKECKELEISTLKARGGGIKLETTFAEWRKNVNK